MFTKAFLCLLTFLLLTCPGSWPVRSFERTTLYAVSSAEVREKPKRGGNSGAEVSVGNYACGLLKGADVEALQGERVKDVKTSERVDGSLTISHCLYLLPTYHKSVSFEVTRSGPNSKTGSGPRVLWMKLFHRDRDEDKDREGEEESGKPLPVLGVGDEAFWTGNKISGALYVLSKDAFLRISVGGPEDQAVKIGKLKVLARKVLNRM